MLLLEAGTFVAAAMSHLGLVIAGYEHQKAATAEGVIALVLLAGLAATWLRPRSARTFSIAAKAFAHVGTLVGIFTIPIGVDPRTAPDIA